MDEAEGPGIWKKIFKYALTPHFVTAYMKFTPNSFWFNNSCMGASQEMADAAFSKGLSCYMGWDQSVYRPNTNQVVRFLFDRIAGANLTTDWPANPLQRPFSWYDLILRDMRARGIDRVPGKDKNENAVTANLQSYVNLNQRNVFGLLAPTISEGQLQGNDLILAGSFGQPNGSLQVTVGGQSMTPAATWNNENEIVVHGLPENGPGASGDVVVSINGHRSNAIRITEWRGRFEVITTGPGSLKTTVTYTLHFRAALKATRDEPNGLARVNLENATAVALSDSTCAFEVDPDGVYETESFKVTQERVGPAEIPFGPADPQRKALMDVVLSGSSQATLQVEFNAFYFVEKDAIKAITFDKQRQQSSSALSGLSPTTARGLTSMDRLLFRILSGQTPNDSFRYAKFNTMEPINPPDLNAARHASPDR